MDCNKVLIGVAAWLFSLLAVESARANITGFTSAGSGSNQYTLNSASSGSPTIVGSSLVLTNNVPSQATSAFYNTQQNITNWTATFTYTLGSSSFPPADGFAFVLQNDPRGLNARGDGGRSLGYSSEFASQIVNSSAALAVDLWNGGGSASTFSRIGAGANGQLGDLTVSSPVNFRTSTPVNVTLQYNDGVLRQSFVQGANSFSRTVNRNLAGYVGNTAWVGFTGGTRGNTAQQTISNFSFTTGTAGSVTPKATLIAGVPQGGHGSWGVREITNNNAVDNLSQAENSILNNVSGNRRVVDYNAPVINIFDSDQTGDFPNSANYASAAPPGPGVGNVQDLALLATGRILVTTSSFYTFAVRSDDGFRLTVGGTRFETALGQGGTELTPGGALQFPTNRGAAERSYGQIYLTAGVHDIQFLHWERGGGASVELSVSRGQKTAFDNTFRLVGDAPDFIPRRAGTISGGWQVANFFLGDGNATMTNAVAAYNAYLDGASNAVASGNYSKIFFIDPNTPGASRAGQSDFGAAVAFPFELGANEDNYATGARATLNISTAGIYTYDVLADDSIRLRIIDSTGNDVNLIGAAGGAGAFGVNTDGDPALDALQTTGCCSDAFGSWNLAVGQYTIELVHFEIGGGSSLQLFGAYGQLSAWDPELFQLLGQNLDTSVFRAGGFQLVAVPEPSTFVMAAIGLVGLLVFRRQRVK